MAYIVQPVASPVLYCDDSLLATYQAAGWSQASPTQIAAWAAQNPYASTQGATPAPPLSGNIAPAPTTAVPQLP